MSTDNVVEFPEQPLVALRTLHVPGVLSERVPLKEITLTKTEVDILRNVARLRLFAPVTGAVLDDIIARWEAA